MTAMEPTAEDERTGGEALVAQLIEEGVVDVFGVPGVQLDWAVDALRKAADRIRLIVPRHEQAAAYMADGYARTSSREGVCMVVPGPGVLNALAGLATAFACNSRVLFIAGQIPSHLIGRGCGVLHEIPDQTGILRSLVKWHGIARTVDDIPRLVNEAFAQLRSGRPRPVALEIPQDVLQATGSIKIVPRAKVRIMDVEPAHVAAAAKVLDEALFPVIYAGGGALAGRAGEAIQALAERLQAPVVMSDNGRGAVSDRHPLALLPLGGRAVLPHADTILVVGSRFLNGRAAPPSLSAEAKVIYVNISPDDVGAPRPAGLVIEADAKAGVEAIHRSLTSPARQPRHDIVKLVKSWCSSQIEALQPQHDLMCALRSSMSDDDIFVSELTQVGYFSGAAMPVYQPGCFLTPGYQGTLGYGFNTALGAAIANPSKRVVSINGDGGFGSGMQELATVARDQLNISIVVFVDGHFGNVRLLQKLQFDADFGTELKNPDFEHLGAGYGIAFAMVKTASSLEKELVAARTSGGPKLIVVEVTEMPSPWGLIHNFMPSSAPPNPLDLIERL